jgi:hypothetical protein
MRTPGIIAVAVLIVGGGLALNAAQPQQPGVKRTDLLRHDLGVPGLAIRARVPLEVLRDTIQPFPTFSEIYVAALKALHGRITAARGPGTFGARAALADSRADTATAV